MTREDFATLFMWGIQFDPHVGWLSLQPKKADKGSYWTPAMLAFLDRLGTRLGFDTDVEIAALDGQWIDMVWVGNDDKQIIFIEHESRWNMDNILKAIARLNSKRRDNNMEADLRVLIAYSWPGKEEPTKEKSEEISRQIYEFVNKDKRNLALVYPYELWPSDKNRSIDLTKFKILPENTDQVSNNSALRLFQRQC